MMVVDEEVSSLAQPSSNSLDDDDVTSRNESRSESRNEPRNEPRNKSPAVKIEAEADGYSSEEDLVDYKKKYRNLKQKLKCLLYEQECFHEELRKFQRKCMRVNRDKSFLLDRLLQYEQPEASTDDANTSSDEEIESLQKVTNNTVVTKGKNKRAANNSNSSPKLEKKAKMNGVSAAVVEKDKVRCRRVENGKPCAKLVSVKVKSGICYAHRQQLNARKQQPQQALNKTNNNKTTTSPPAKVKQEKQQQLQPLKQQCGGGKDIGQIREAMEADARLETSSPGLYGEDDDDLVIDLPH